MEEDKKIKFKKRARFVLKLVSYSLICFLMIISAFLVFYVFSSKYYQSKGKIPPFALYTIVSSSMEPTIDVYDVVFIKKTNPAKLDKGDIITFYSSNPFFGNTPITHRIEKVIKEDDDIFFEVKGDANEISDQELVLSLFTLLILISLHTVLPAIHYWTVGSLSQRLRLLMCYISCL